LLTLKLASMRRHAPRIPCGCRQRKAEGEKCEQADGTVPHVALVSCKEWMLNGTPGPREGDRSPDPGFAK
jgi:hypothetical protein